MLYLRHLINFSLLLTLFLFSSLSLFGQRKERVFSPKTASLYSAVVPGAGQIYNRKYWKVPLVYAAVGTSIYFIDFNTRNFKSYKNALIARQDGDSTTVDLKYIGVSDDLVTQNMDYYRRLRDISYFALAASYILNIIDASVDAHLKEFDVSDDLNLSFAPIFIENNLSPGLTLTYTLK